MSKKIYLSPSNQDGNMYAYGNISEMEQCNKFANAAKAALERCGFEVKKAPEGQKMSVSIAESNAWGADLHIPIHTNACTNNGTGAAGGTIVFVYSTADNANMALATPIYRAVQAVTPGKTEYGVRAFPDLAELNGTNCTAVYIEVDFHDNPPIAKWLVENVQTVGEAIAKGVCEGCGVKYIPPATTATAASAKSGTGTIYRVQVGAFSDKTLAEHFLQTVKDKGLPNAFLVEVKK